MYTLFLDLASHKQLIALVDDERTLTSAAVESRTGEEHLLPLIESMLAKMKCTFQDLGRIATTTGPGGFMSLRVGIALANALSDTLGIPLAGVHLSEIWRMRANEEKSFLWLHSTKQNLMFIRGFGELKKKWPEPVLESVEHLQAAITKKTIFIGELLESQKMLLPHLQPLGNVQSIEDVLPTLLANAQYEQKPLQPWYGRGA